MRPQKKSARRLENSAVLAENSKRLADFERTGKEKGEAATGVAMVYTCRGLPLAVCLGCSVNVPPTSWCLVRNLLAKVRAS